MVITKKWMYKKIKIPFKKNGINLDLEKLKVESVGLNLEEPHDGKYSLNFLAQNIPNFPKKDNLYLVTFSPYMFCFNRNCHIFMEKDNNNLFCEFLDGQLEYFNYKDFMECNSTFNELRAPFVNVFNERREICPYYMNIDFKDGCMNLNTAKKCLINGIILVSKILMEQTKLNWNLIDINFLKRIQVDFGLNYLEVEDFVEKMSNISLFNEDDVLYKCIYYNYDYSWFDSRKFIAYGIQLLRFKSFKISNFLLKYQFHANFIENKNFSKHQDVRIIEKYHNFDDCLNDIICNKDGILYLVSLCYLTGDMVIILICNEEGSKLLNKNWFSNKECCSIKEYNMDFYTNLVKIALYIDYYKKK